MSNTSLENAQRVVEWIKSNDGFWDSTRLELRKSRLGGVGVFAKEDIGEQEYEGQNVLLRLHKKVLLSAQNSSIANLIIDEELDGAIALVVAFIYEKHKIEDSPWKDYISTIKYTDNKSKPILPPSLWLKKQKLILEGSELELMGALDESENQDAFERACTFAINQNESSSIEIPWELDIVDKTDEDVKERYQHFIAISNAIASRDFEIDEFHQVALCPGADLFNHTNRNNVRFESFFEVCAMCGARECGHEPMDHEEMLEEMLEEDEEQEHSDHDGRDHAEHEEGEEGESEEDHDIEDGSSNESDEESEFEGPIEDFITHIEEAYTEDREEAELEEKEELEEFTGPVIKLFDQEKTSHPEDCCDIFLFKPVTKGEEIFNTYGDFSNVVLLSKYGFVIQDNVNNTVSLGIQCLKLKKDKQYSRHFQWWDEAGYPMMRDHLQTKNKHHSLGHKESGGCCDDKEGECCGASGCCDDDDDDDEIDSEEDEDVPSWAMEMRLEHNGQPSQLTYALFKLLSMKSPELHKFLQKREPDVKILTTTSPKAYKLLREVMTSRERLYNSDMDYVRLAKSGGSRERLAAQLVLDELQILNRAKSFIQKKT